MKLVIALGGNALLRRGQALSAENQLENIRLAANQLALVAAQHDVVLTHGNGPQIGVLALQSAASKAGAAYPLDVLGAQTEGMLGYLLEQELCNLLPATRTVATLLTRVEVDLNDPAFAHPSKPIGPVYTKAELALLVQGAGQHWHFAADGIGMRRVVASPKPVRVFGIDPIRWLLAHGALVIAAGGGGIPVTRGADGKSLYGVEAVIDKDLCSGLLAAELGADVLLIATDVAAVYHHWGQPDQRAFDKVTPAALARYVFPAGSMGPKVAAACRFVTDTGGRAVIGALDQILAMLSGSAGTQVSMDGADS
jgi:carbamate kinase